MERKQFTFYESFARSISHVKSKATRCDIYDAICNYALYGMEPEVDRLPDAAAMAFELIRPTLDASKRKAESGKRGGETQANAKQTASKTEANAKQNRSEGQTARENEKEKEKEGENEKEVERENECSPLIVPPQAGGGQKRTRFTPPTVEKVSAYCRERGNSVDAQRFVDFYASKGWKVGSQHMKDWKAAVRTWEHREDVAARKDQTKAPSAPARDAPTAAEVDRMKRALAAMKEGNV